MKKLDFRNFSVPTGITRQTREVFDAREQIHMAVERYCLPNVIDALNEILGGSETDKNE